MSNQSFKVKSGLTLTPVDLTTLLNPQAGDLACDSNDSNKIKRYDAASSSWTEVGSGAAGDVDTLLVQDFDSASLSSFTQTGLALVTTNQLDGRQSARLIHQPLVGAIQSFKETFSVSPKYRGVNMTASLLLRSSASQGNVTIQFRDETNSVDYPSQQLQTNSQEIASLVTNSTTLVSGFSNSSINSLKVGMSVTGSGIPTGTVISSINSTALTITLSQAATASATVSLRFSDLPRTIQLGFQIPANCSSYSYTISALQEAGLPETYIDDIVLKNYWLGMSNQGQSELTYNTIESQNIFINSGSASVNIDMTNTVVAENKGIAGIISHSSGVITVLKKCNLSIDFIATQSAASGDMYPYIKRNGTIYAQNLAARTAVVGGYTEPVSANLIAEAGDTFTFGSGGVGVSNCKIMITAEAAVEKSITTNDLVPAKAVLGNTSLEIPSITGWQGYTPTFQGFGSPTNIEFEWRQVGENVEIRGKFTLGATTGVEARVGLPAGLTSAGTGIIPSLQICGHAAFNVNSTTYFSTEALIEPSVSYLTFGQQTSTTAGLAKANGNMGSLGNILSFFASVPCAGLSATEEVVVSGTQSALVQEEDSLLRLSTANGYGSSFTVGRRFSSIIESKGDGFVYQDSATLGTTITITEDGFYSFSYTDSFTGSAQMGLSLNYSTVAAPSALPNANRLAASYTNTNTYAENVSWSGPLVAGDVVRPITDGIANNGICILNVSRVGTLKQLNVSSDQKITIPTSELRFEGASARGTSPSNTIVKFDTLAKLRGDAFTVNNDAVLGTSIVVNKAGLLSVSANIQYATGAAVSYISKNQANLNSAPTSSEQLAAGYDQSASNMAHNIAWSGFVQVGDVIRISTSTAPSSSSINNLNLSFQEQDISVSVTNTLPQFSESDSSVRVDTANGYGSTNLNIRRFSNVRDNIGTDVTYIDSASEGAKFVINENGIYNISYIDNFTSSSSAYVGISKNSNQLSTQIFSINGADILASAFASGATGTFEASWSGYLVKGDVIRPHVGNVYAASNNALSSFTISKVGKPNVTGVDVTPFVNVPQPDFAHARLSGRNTVSSGNMVFDTVDELFGNNILNVDTTLTYHRVTILKDCYIDINYGTGAVSLVNIAYPIYLYKNGISIASSQPGDAGTGNIPAPFVAFSGKASIGDVFTFGAPLSAPTYGDSTVYANLKATALSDQILTAPETFSTDTASLQYASSVAYTLSTLQNAPVGTYITFTYAANTNTRTQTTTRPTQTDADMNANGIQIFTRAYNALSSAAQPAAIAIQIGKGLKGRTLDLYKSVGKVTNGSLDLWGASGVAVRSGVHHKEYNELTGILIIDAGYNSTASATNCFFEFNDNTTQTSGYLVINASKNPALTGLNVLLPRIATLSDVKVSGTNGGTSSTTYAARILNTVIDPTGIITNSSAFTGTGGTNTTIILEAGTYVVKGESVWLSADSSQSRGKIKLRNITDGVDVVQGTSFVLSTIGVSGSNFGGVTQINGMFVITSQKSLELQMVVNTARATNGLGAAMSQGDEVYSVLQIEKIK